MFSVEFSVVDDIGVDDDDECRVFVMDMIGYAMIGYADK